MLHRAYALLEVKALDAERRVITGIATTPTPDRMGDVIEPLGVSFTNPLPLLLHHDQAKPVGTATLDKPTAQGVTFTASLPIITEPGPLKDRVDEAWQSLKAGLIRGVSIGYRPVQGALERLTTGGVRFTKSLVAELSLCTVPSNAEATILTIKSLDAPHLAALGPDLSGVSDVLPVVRVQKDAPTMLTTAEQITQWSNTRAPKITRINDLMAKTATNGVTLDDAEGQEYETLKLEVKSIDTQLARLREVEQMNISAATPITTTAPNPVTASELRGGHAPVIQVKSVLPPGIEFARYAICLLAAKGNLMMAHEIAKARYPDEGRIQLVLKAAVSAGTTTDATWAGSLVDYTNFAGDFIDFLRPQTIIGKFGQNGVPDLTRVPFNVRIQSQTSGGDAYWVGQGAPKPLTNFDFAPVTLTWAKVANIAVLSDELVRFSSPSAETLVRNALAAAIAGRLDTDFVDPDKAAVANVSPASITNGLTPITSGAADTAGVRTDIAAVLAPFIAAEISPAGLVWIMNATVALRLSLMVNTNDEQAYPTVTMQGGTFQGFPVIVSNYLAGTDVVLVNAPDIYLADDGQVTIDASREASLQMDDAPTNNSATPTATTMVSMFQTNSVALRAERYINWAKRRAAAAAYITDVDWGGTETA
jgi:HK97 family phage major capsid protein/HK97 family phage prohead protease